jgi:ferredoxin-NADP reductase
VAIEGPYGVFTAETRESERVLLVGAGVGITPVRALLEELPESAQAVVILRGSTHEDVVLGDEVADLVADRGGRLHELVGPRGRVRLDSHALTALVPDVAERDLYVCGPEAFQDALIAAARDAGVPDTRIHHESFSF